MDESDLQIIKLLIFNSRLSYREIAEHVDLSLNAVYKRVQNLVELGVIRRFTAKINSYAVGAFYCFFYGKSEVEDVDKVISLMQQDKNVVNLMLSSRNYLYIGSFLQDVHKMGSHTSNISKIANITSPTVGLRDGSYYKCPISYIIPKSKTLNIDKLDIAIIKSLRYDSRKPISEVADEVTSTPNTVRRRLSRLVEEGLVELSIEFYPEASGDIYSIILIRLHPVVDKTQLAEYLVDKYQPFVLYCWSFSNLPNTLLCWVWSNTINQLNNLIENLKKEKIETLVADIIRKGWFLDSWIDDILSKTSASF